MPTNLFGRTMLIVTVLVASLWAVFPGFFRGDFRHNLKPGIDMVGGTALIYEIKGAAGSGGGAAAAQDMAEKVSTSLKQRVDPDGTKNYVWRPSGNQLEIQVPLTAEAKAAEGVRDQFAAAQRAVEATNIRVGAVESAIEIDDPAKADERRAKLAQYAQGSNQRSALFAELASVWDQLRDARKKLAADPGDIGALDRVARLEKQYEEAKAKLPESNLPPAELDTILELQDAKLRDDRIAALKQQSAGFDARLKAIDDYVAKWGAWHKVRDAVDSTARLKRDLQGSGVLTFNILATDITQDQFAQWQRRLQEDGPRPRPGDEMRWYELDRKEKPLPTTTDYNGKRYVLAYVTPERSLMKRENLLPWSLASANTNYDQGRPIVEFRFDPQGAKYFGELSGRHVPSAGREWFLGIVLDEKLISAPRINSRIEGSGQITGEFTDEQVTYLVNTMNAGSLPAQLTEEPISERTIGPQLGEDNLRAGFVAGVIGLIVVAIFMIGYYYTLGVVATFAVILNVVMILGGMAMLGATFTLPGVAGIVLTIGMAVDANVLINERLREEQERGLSLRMAMRNAYDRAFSAILDGSLTTAITSAMLYIFGSEEVRGFGITLLIGLVSSMFTALFVTKTIFAFMIDRMGVTDLTSLPRTFPRWQKMLHPNWDWVHLLRYFAAFSAVFVIGGLALLVYRGSQGYVMDIEFTGGTSVQLTLKDPMPIAEVRKMVDDASAKDPLALPSPTVQSVGGDGKSYEIAVPNDNTNQVKQKVIALFGDRLNVNRPSTFANSDKDALADVLNTTVIPIADRQTRVEGAQVEDVRAHLGGAAIVLKDMNPPMPREQLALRIEQAALEAGGARPWSSLDIDVVDNGRTAVLLFHNNDLAYNPADAVRQAAWTDQVAAPAWRLIREAVTRDAQLQRVTKFGGQVADQAKTDTVIAIVFSIIGIMIYVWFRFGTLQYGIATVVACVHDAVFVLAAIGWAHYLAMVPGLGTGLLLEPFRVNLTIVAAVLTVIGYSMNDTVVVFDRIRENRGKYGHLSRQIINDSINQTLSRTLLTAGTTFLTTIVMYIFGGAGVHGFMFVMMIGILVGTYSSIAIAAPVLLWSKDYGPADDKSGVPAKLQGAAQ
jgi:SecD/SecF fusion protein